MVLVVCGYTVHTGSLVQIWVLVAVSVDRPNREDMCLDGEGVVQRRERKREEPKRSFVSFWLLSVVPLSLSPS